MTMSDAHNIDKWIKLAPWEKYHSDLELTVHHTLTEPTCPTVSVRFELDSAPIKKIATVSGNTVEEAIDLALQIAEKKLEIWLHLTVAEILEIEQEKKDEDFWEGLQRKRWIKSLGDKNSVRLG